jgi:hypothetical protein
MALTRLATDWTVRGSNPGGGEIFRKRPDRPWGPPSLPTIGTASSPGVKQPGRSDDHPPLLMPRSRKSTAIPLPPLGIRVCYWVPLPNALTLKRRN